MTYTIFGDFPKKLRKYIKLWGFLLPLKLMLQHAITHFQRILASKWLPGPPLPGRRVRFHLQLPVPRQASRLQLQAPLLCQLGGLGCLLVLGLWGTAPSYVTCYIS